jgi:hypothetical protein
MLDDGMRHERVGSGPVSILTDTQALSGREVLPGFASRVSELLT